MKPFRTLTARAAVLDRPDVDTDQIIPKQFLKRIERTGFGEVLFFDWRKDPGFELNGPGAQNARLLLAGRNFGCGSSREHAPWALQESGYEVIVASSFADIFVSNCVKVGLVPIALAPDEVRRLMDLVDLEGEAAGGARVEVDGDLLAVLRARHELLDLVGGKLHREQPDLVRVLPEDVAERRRDDRVEAVVLQRPRRMLARRAAAEVPTRQE